MPIDFLKGHTLHRFVPEWCFVDLTPVDAVLCEKKINNNFVPMRWYTTVYRTHLAGSAGGIDFIALLESTPHLL